MSLYDILIPTIPHRHERLCPLLAELDRQMVPGVGVIAWQDNLEASYGDKCQGLLEASRADYVAFLDDDDWIAPDYVEAIAAALHGKPDYVGFPVVYTIDGVAQVPVVHSLNGDHGYAAECRVSDIVHKNPIRRDLALTGRWSGGWGADGRWGAEVRATGRVRAEAWIGEPMYHYRYSNDDEFRTPREPLPGPLPPLPAYEWLTVL